MADTNSYFAGFFDGEGCVAIYRKKYVVSLTNTDIRPLVLAKERWGGHISVQTKETREFAVQDLYRWQIYGHKSRQFLEDVLPFCVVKHDQILCYLAALNVVPRGRGARREENAGNIIDIQAARLKVLKRSGGGCSGRQ